MDIEELTKSQIFLLTLLTSFVTSIATGIITVALLDQAPPIITQSVHRVIQSTVERAEKATPTKTPPPVAAAVAVPLQTPPPREKTLSEIVTEVLPSIVRLQDRAQGLFLGFGIVLDTSGTIVVDAEALLPKEKAFTIVFADGVSQAFVVAGYDGKNGLAFLIPEAATTSIAYVPAKRDENPVSIAQNIVAIVGKSAPRIASGLVVAVESGSASTPMITTDIDSLLISKGTPLINTDGAIVGISTAHSRSIDGSTFMPISAIAADYKSTLTSESEGRIKSGTSSR